MSPRTPEEAPTDSKSAASVGRVTVRLAWRPAAWYQPVNSLVVSTDGPRMVGDSWVSRLDETLPPALAAVSAAALAAVAAWRACACSSWVRDWISAMAWTRLLLAAAEAS